MAPRIFTFVAGSSVVTDYIIISVQANEAVSINIISTREKPDSYQTCLSFCSKKSRRSITHAAAELKFEETFRVTAAFDDMDERLITCTSGQRLGCRRQRSREDAFIETWWYIDDRDRKFLENRACNTCVRDVQAFGNLHAYNTLG